MAPTARTGTTGFLSVAIVWTWLAGAAAAQVPLLEVETSDATKVLQVDDAAGFVVQGKLNAGAIPASGAGVRFMWYPKNAALRAGIVQGDEWDDGNVGLYSVAFGVSTVASGNGSTAIGQETRARGLNATAMGWGSKADGVYSTGMGYSTNAAGPQATAMGNSTSATGPISTAMGIGTSAEGRASTAMGDETKAIGGGSTAMGYRTQATNNASTAMGSLTVASGPGSTALGIQTTAAGIASVALGTGITAQGDGSFAFGDRTTSFPVIGGPNTFSVRAFGGVGLNTGVDIGCDLPPGVGSWSCTSSRLAKERFEDVDGEAVLAKLATIPVQRWHYRGTPARHVGPTAEDFYAAFGLGQGPTTISGVDADGIALRAVQALERRTAALRSENAELRRRLAALEAEQGRK